jgi:RHS repeat-associated protein
LREITYDQYGFVSAIKTGHGNANGQYTVTQVNDQWGNVIQRIDERGVIHTFEYDNNNRITKSRITNPDNAAEYVETSYSYDHAGRLKRIDRPGGAYTEMGYDAHNRLLYTVDQFERVTSFVYDSAGRLVKRIEPTGNIIRHEYNAFGNLIQTSDESGSTEQYSFDKLFRMSGQTDADGYSISMAYDQYGRLRERNTHLNEETTLSEQYQYDAWGLRTIDSDYRGFTRNYAYDNRQRLSTQTAYGFNSALHYTRQSEYDILDRPTSIDINGRENIFANDYTQSEFTSTDPLNRQVKNVLDAAGNVLSTIDPSGAVRSYEYDYLGRLKKKTRPDGVNTSYEYNERQNLSVERVKTTTGALLLLHEHEYDNGDRRVKTTITDYTTNLSVELNYSYDRGNRLLKVHELPADTEIRYTYDKASRISTVTIPAQHRELRYVYDGRGNKVNTYIRDTRNNRFTMQAFEYDALNRLTYAYSEYYGEVHIEYFDGEFTSTEELRRRVTYPSGIKAEFYHDAFDRPIRIAWIKDDNQIMAHSYEYDSFDRIIRKTVDSPSGQRQENYSFDLADRLIAALTPEGTINYDYDQNDNMTSIYHSGNAERQVNFVTDNQYQELLTGASYPAFGRSFTFGLDALGRRITDQNISNNALHVRTYAFDPMSRLSAVSSVKAPLPNAEPWPAEELEYSYLPGSPLRRTLTKQQPAQTTRRHFIWDGANELESLSEFTASGNTDYFAEIFLSDPAIMDKRFGAAKNQNAFLDEGAEGIDYITDQQNTINASYKDSNITDEQHFSPYGQPVTFTLPEGTELTKFAYTGRNYDAPADLYYYRGRYYDACSARFLNPDPIENRLNWTGYVGGNPINMVDPSGYYTFENGEVDEEKEWVSSETPYSPFTIENQCVEISPNWRKAKEQIAILKQIQSDLINKIDRLSEKDPIGLLYRETASSTERRRKEYILTELRSLLDSKSKKVYVQPGLYDGVREGRHNFFTRNITIHTPQTDSLKLQYFLLHESMHHLDSFNLNSSSYDKSGLMREIFWESYVYPNYTERNKFQSGKQAPYNADSAASWLNYLLR